MHSNVFSMFKSSTTHNNIIFYSDVEKLNESIHNDNKNNLNREFGSFHQIKCLNQKRNENVLNIIILINWPGWKFQYVCGTPVWQSEVEVWQRREQTPSLTLWPIQGNGMYHKSLVYELWCWTLKQTEKQYQNLR